MAKPKQKKVFSLDSYTFTDYKRTNNPPVGLVSDATDTSQTKKTKYSHDPHISPHLSWAGKVEGLSFEVPNVSLHIHERIDPQRIAKSFLKKKDQPTQPSLFEDPYNELPLLKAVDFYGHEQDWSNRLIAGDSLLVMNSLLQKEGMAEKVQMVYIDPPYGIKYNSNFQPFLNKRDVKDNNDSDIPAEPETIQAFRDTWELGVHSYLTHLHNRLLLAKELLNESGSCFVQISDENIHHVREIMDEIFGPENFCNLITFQKTGSISSNNLGTTVDYVIWYAKNKSKMKYRQLYLPREEGSPSLDRYDYVENEKGELIKIPASAIRGETTIPPGRRCRLTTLLSDGEGKEDKYFEFEGKKYYARTGKHWKTDPYTGGQKLIAKGRIVRMGETLWYKRYLDDFQVLPLNDRWESIQIGQELLYVVQTAPLVIQRCLLMTTDPGDLVLDPTCGSGTTACVAEKWGRRWITCDTSRVAIALTKQRFMTSQFDYYELGHPKEGISSGFLYKTVPHVTLGSIANDEPVQEETLYDQPYIDKSKIRLTGPFTLEAVPSLRTKPFNGAENKINAQGNELARIGETNNLNQWIDELRTTGIRATGGEIIQFNRLEPSAGTVSIQAMGQVSLPSGASVGTAVSFGPDYGPLEQRQVEQTINEVQKLRDGPKYVVFSAFQFDPEAAKDIDQMNDSNSEFTVLKAQMSVDLLTSDLRKKRSSNQSFWLIGQPDIELSKLSDGVYQVKVNGFDYYNPATGEIESGSTKHIAMWMLDTDYDERSIFPQQVFFPGHDSEHDWTKLAKALNGAVDEEFLERFTGTVSLPFKPGDNKKIAVKIIDNRGIESFVVKAL